MKTTDSSNRSGKERSSLQPCLVSAGLHACSGRDRLDKPDCQWRYTLLGSRAGSLCPSCFALWLREQIGLEIFFTRDERLCMHVCGEEVLLEGRKMRTEEAWLNRSLNLIALLFLLELALQRWAGMHLMGRNDLTKLEGELRIWTERY